MNANLSNSLLFLTGYSFKLHTSAKRFTGLPTDTGVWGDLHNEEILYFCAEFQYVGSNQLADGQLAYLLKKLGKGFFRFLFYHVL